MFLNSSSFSLLLTGLYFCKYDSFFKLKVWRLMFFASSLMQDVEVQNMLQKMVFLCSFFLKQSLQLMGCHNLSLFLLLGRMDIILDHFHHFMYIFLICFFHSRIDIVFLFFCPTEITHLFLTGSSKLILFFWLGIWN